MKNPARIQRERREENRKGAGEAWLSMHYSELRLVRQATGEGKEA
jgi:hypothetical protein